jgi:hypothetical protein
LEEWHAFTCLLSYLLFLLLAQLMLKTAHFYPTQMLELVLVSLIQM